MNREAGSPQSPQVGRIARRRMLRPSVYTFGAGAGPMESGKSRWARQVGKEPVLLLATTWR